MARSWLGRLFGGRGADDAGAGSSPGGAYPPAERGSPLRKLARRLELPPRRLAFVLWHDPQPYREIRIRKRDGRERLLHAPSSARKFVQRRLLRRVLDRQAPVATAHGFVKRRDIFTGARHHVGQPLVIRIDLEDFFPSISAARVGGVFKSLGFEGAAVRMLVMLCTHEGRLPQGAPTSPSLANLVCRRLDRRLWKLARRNGYRYTRYADDITLSGPLSMKKVLPLVRRIIAEEGFVIAEHKTRLMRWGRRQEVTGLVVNRRLSVPRYRRRWIRAIVHNVKKNGLAAENRYRLPRFREFIAGNAAFIARSHPDEAARLQSDLDRQL
jgi:retron-type reverse transcriptase